MSDFTAPNPWHMIFIVTTTLCIILPTLVTWARIYTKLRPKYTMSVEDYLILFAWLLSMVFTGFAYVLDSVGLGRPQQVLSVSRALHLSTFLLIDAELWCVAIVAVKLAILLQYMRVFVPIREGKLFWTVTILIWANTLCYSIFAIVNIAQCVPIGNHCVPAIPSVVVASSMWNIFSDFSLLALPMYSIWQIRMPISQKIQFSALFAFGSLTCVLSIVRAVLSIQLLYEQGRTYKVAALFFCGMAEIAIALLCASLPFLPRFLKQVSRRKTQSPRCSSPEDFPAQRKHLFTVGSPSTLKSFVPWFRFRESSVDKVDDSSTSSRGSSPPMVYDGAKLGLQPQPSGEVAIAVERSLPLYDASESTVTIMDKVYKSSRRTETRVNRMSGSMDASSMV